MTNENWLNEPINQAEFQAMATAIVNDVAPQELAVLVEIFPKYLTVAGDVGAMKVSSRWGEDMAFENHTSLFSMILLPVLTVVIQKWLHRYDSSRVYRLIHRREPISVDERDLVKLIDQTLKKSKLPRRQRKAVVPILAEAIVIFHRDNLEADAFTMYEEGLERLLERMSVTDAGYGDVLVYEQRLLENVRMARLHGDTDLRQSNRSEIIGQLNRVTLDALGVSFNALCAGAD